MQTLPWTDTRLGRHLPWADTPSPIACWDTPPSIACWDTPPPHEQNDDRYKNIPCPEPRLRAVINKHRTQCEYVLASVFVQYEHFHTILYNPFFLSVSLLVSVSDSVDAPLVMNAPTVGGNIS